MSSRSPRTTDPELLKLDSGERGLLRVYRTNAATRGYPWSLTPSQAQVLFHQDCHYCGSPPEERRIGKYAAVLSGIDRVVNDQGYVPGNVVPCCKFCNRAKGSDSAEDFQAWILRLRRLTSDPT